MMTDDELQSKTIDFLRFPLAIMVMFIHIPLVFDIQRVDYFSLTCMETCNIIKTGVSHVLAQMAVPCFFMFSGFLFFYKIATWNIRVYGEKLKRRIRTLLVPYLLWTLICIFFMALLSLIGGWDEFIQFLNELNNSEQGHRGGIIGILWGSSGHFIINILGQFVPVYSPYMVTLWFVRDLILMVIISPLVYLFLKHTRLYGVLLLGILYYLKIEFVIGRFSLGMFLTAVFFFSLGAYFSIEKKNIILSLRKGNFLWLLLAIISLLASTYFDGAHEQKYFLPLYTISGVITVINMCSYLIERQRVKVHTRLAESSFFVYVAHPLLLIPIGKLLERFPSDSCGLALLSYFMRPLLCALLLVLAYCLLKRFAPKLSGLLTGRK